MDPALLSALGALFGHATGESTESTGDAPSASIAILTVPGRGIVGTAITPNGARRGGWCGVSMELQGRWHLDAFGV